MTRLTARVMAEAERWLRGNDPELGRLIDEHGPCPLHVRRTDPFNVLAWSIINQQLSTQAANTIGQRVMRLCGEPRLTASALARTRADKLRAAGLSNNKVRFLKGIAGAVEDGDLNFRSLAQLPDEAVSEKLIELPGVGEWTAQMFLMFALRRADVFSPADIGLQRAAQTIYGLKRRPTGETFERFARRWRPYRTVACWYLWRHAD